MSTQTVPRPSGSPRDNVFARPQPRSSLRARVIETVSEWRRRMASRRELCLLSQADLKDIGYPARVEAEKSKPFWQE
jgi:uncharacterized protein YjiS (DUF1127 family)